MSDISKLLRSDEVEEFLMLYKNGEFEDFVDFRYRFLKLTEQLLSEVDVEVEQDDGSYDYDEGYAEGHRVGKEEGLDEGVEDTYYTVEKALDERLEDNSEWLDKETEIKRLKEVLDLSPR